MQDFQISVGLVLYNERERIEGLLKALEDQSIGIGAFEVIAVDNYSTDATLAFLKKYQESSVLNIKVLERTENNIGAARADIVNCASSDLVAFIDGDCLPSSTWISELLAQYFNHAELNSETAGVGSSAVYSEGHYFARCIYSMSKVFMGHLNSNQIRRVQESTESKHIPTSNVCYKKEAILSVGNFSESYARVCEDVELNFRLVERGYKLFFLPSPTVLHQVSPNPLKWFTKIFKYGSGQFLVVDEHPKHLQIRLTLPLVFISSLIFWLVLMTQDFRFLWLGWLYFALITAQSLRALNGTNEIILFPGLITAFFITHLAYSCGELYGLVRYLVFKLSGVRQ